MDAKVLCVAGTRPEVIKMAPVIRALQSTPWANVRILASGQQRDLLRQIMGVFNMRADIDLAVMQANQSLSSVTARVLERLDPILMQERPGMVLAQGDTTTVFATALACFHRNIPFGHVEAGLRTGNLHSPFPEEFNRISVARLAAIHFAPTVSAKENLLKEGIPSQAIHVTGNTVIDALLEVARRHQHRRPIFPKGKRGILATIHRRESFGLPLRAIFSAIRRLVAANSDIAVLYPVHPNPNVKNLAEEMLGGIDRIELCAPLEYTEFVAAMEQAYIILTDSGGVQEEAPALGKPVLVLRPNTERPEAVTAGVARVVGTDSQQIVSWTQKLLDDHRVYRDMARGLSPYGDGQAASRIVAALATFLRVG